MNPSKVDTIATWPLPKTHQEVQVFFSFANFYYRFIQLFSKVSSSLSELLKKSTKGSFKGMKFVMTNQAVKLFDKLKQFFACPPMLIHYDLAYQIMLKCNVLRFAITAILSQLVSKTGQWHLVTF